MPLLLHDGQGGIGFTFRFAQFPGRLNEDLALSAILQWCEEILGVEPEDRNDLPVVALGWFLIGAKQGPAVQPPEPQDNGHPT